MKMLNRLAALIFCAAFAMSVTVTGQMNSHDGHSHTGHSKKLNLAPSYSWGLIPPLGLHTPETIDTLLYNYQRKSVPSAVSNAWASTGNLGSPGLDMLFEGRTSLSDFFFRDGLEAWIPTYSKMKFYNTRAPMTLVSFNSSGGRETAQERLQATFSGNINAKAQVGAMVDYLYSKGSYANQAVKNLGWGVNGSYIGDRYEFQGYFNHYNSLNKENGGITNALYITDPAELQAGVNKIEAKSIPTRLSAAHSRVRGEDLYINNRYKVGYWEEKHDSVYTDSVVERRYVAVSSFIHTLQFQAGKHMFLDTRSQERNDFFENTYLNPDITQDWTTYWSLRNTLGISMIEGFHRLAKFGLAAYATYEIRKYTQTPDTLDRTLFPELTPLPEGVAANVSPKATQNLLWVGGQLTKQRGSVLTYSADARFGLVGAAAGDLSLEGRISTHFRLPAVDSLSLTAFGNFHSEHAPYLLQNYVSNHFAWHNEFGKQRRVGFGGELSIPRTSTKLRVGVTNLQNYIYFGSDFTPKQKGGSTQVLSASLQQNLKLGILHWDNSVTYQASSDADVLPLPALTVYSNLYILFRFATLQVQLGVDCDYYTSYRGMTYQPATMSFAVQPRGKEVLVGNYPFCNAYANMKIKKARFYVLFSHVNQGLFGGSDFFAMPLYPMNPRRFQIGISVDFAN